VAPHALVALKDVVDTPAQSVDQCLVQEVVPHFEPQEGSQGPGPLCGHDHRDRGKVVIAIETRARRPVHAFGDEVRKAIGYIGHVLRCPDLGPLPRLSDVESLDRRVGHLLVDFALLLMLAPRSLQLVLAPLVQRRRHRRRARHSDVIVRESEKDRLAVTSRWTECG
jgi:hypothetical protein